uniref:Uncharacterized protein n=1 Tax=Candidatus Methanogaster sp. ANME-2c ERB4 TaxID=2759911 RepID=A0A7G9Y380_9EURY|nr:hypothetical protein LBOOMNCC_00017 [Methanosarcinales archaeon ANME-2c ERB4]
MHPCGRNATAVAKNVTKNEPDCGEKQIRKRQEQSTREKIVSERYFSYEGCEDAKVTDPARRYTLCGA